MRIALCTDSDVFVADIFAQLDGLNIVVVIIQQLNREWMMLYNFCLSVPYEVAYPAGTERRHQTLTIFANNADAWFMTEYAPFLHSN